MRTVLSPIAALLLSVAILVMGNGLQQTLLPVRASLESFDALEIGLMGSAYYLGFVLGCVRGGRLIQRVGHIRAFTALAAIASTVALVHALSVQPYMWTLMRALTGFCFAGLYLVIESWLNDKADNTNRGFVMGVYTMVNLSVIVAGQMMLTLADPQQFPLFALASILVSIAAVPVALTASPQPAPLAEARLRPIRLYRLSPVGVVGVLLVGVTNGAFWALGPAYAAGIGAGTNEIAIFMSIAVMGGALAQWPVGRLSDRFDRRFVLMGGCVLGIAAALGLVLVGGAGGWPLAALACLFGAAALPLYAICVAHAFDFVERKDLVEAASGLLLANGAGSVIGPMIAAAAMREAGPAGLFASTAVFHLLLGGFALWRMTRRTALPAEARTGFDLTSTAQTMVALEPQPPSSEASGEPSPPVDGLDPMPADGTEERLPG
jgi:MFS family permease